MLACLGLFPAGECELGSPSHFSSDPFSSQLTVLMMFTSGFGGQGSYFCNCKTTNSTEYKPLMIGRINELLAGMFKPNEEKQRKRSVLASKEIYEAVRTASNVSSKERLLSISE